MSEFQAHVETPLNPTEDPDKVFRAVRNLFPNSTQTTAKVDARRSKLQATMTRLEDLDNLRSLLRSEAIRDAARRLLLQSVSGSSIVVHLNKQAAFAGKVSFCERYDESPLGPITLTITTERPEQVIDWLAPSSRGRQLSESR
ncbi:RNA-binding domain-containing protein [[Eubacterium] cellulosolvens]